MRYVRPRIFLAILLSIFGLLEIAIGFDLLVLWKAGELRSLNAIVDKQQKDGSLYGGLSTGLADYKYATYRKLSPEIVAIGTSRVMQIRQSFFHKPFYNLGGLARGEDQANVLASRLILRGPVPKVVIFALDFWTFCGPPPPGIENPTQHARIHDGMGQPSFYFLIYRLLLDGNLSPANLKRLLLQRAGPNDSDRIGISARVGHSAFAPDGSVYNMAPPLFPLSRRWAQMLTYLQQGRGQMIDDCTVSKVALNELHLFIDRMHGDGLDVVLIMAPLPAVMIDQMKADGRHRYIDEVRNILSVRYHKIFYDFFDMRDIAADSEFYEAIHGGEVVYMRIIRAIARDPRSPLHGLVNEEYLESQIQAWAGHDRLMSGPTYQRFFSPPVN